MSRKSLITELYLRGYTQEDILAMTDTSLETTDKVIKNFKEELKRESGATNMYYLSIAQKEIVKDFIISYFDNTTLKIPTNLKQKIKKNLVHKINHKL
jgi:transposase